MFLERGIARFFDVCGQKAHADGLWNGSVGQTILIKML
jgi:hypothetical protein